MDARQDMPPDPDSSLTRRRAGWAVALLAAALLAAAVVGAYRQPELLQNFMGLRYCG